MITVNTELWQEKPFSADLCEPLVEECLLWEEYTVRPGLRLAVQNLAPLQTAASYKFVVKEAAPFEFMCFVSGRTCVTLTDCHGTGHTVDNRSGEYSLSHLPRSYGEAITHAGEKVQAVGLLAMPRILSKAAHKKSFLLEPGMFADHGGFSSFIVKAAIPPHLALIVHEVLECPLGGPMRQVFMEYKAMELLFSLMKLLDEDISRKNAIASFERDAARRAHDIILGSIADPPSLQTLAKRVGLTHTRLNAVFQLLFGTTVFSFLREKRLERARRLLEKPRQGITETAYECGFSSPSHFTRAFAERYGLTPSRYHAGFTQSRPRPLQDRPRDDS